MGFRIVAKSEATTPRRNKRSGVKEMKEFEETLAVIRQGKLTPQQVIEVDLPKTDKRGFRFLRATFTRFLKDELKKLHLEADYVISSHSTDTAHIIQVSYEPPMVKAKKH
jgi:hypothetical protein